MTLLYLAIAFGFGYMAGNKRLLKPFLPKNKLTDALDAEQAAMEARMVQTLIQQMRAPAPAPGSTPPSAN